MKTRSFAVDLLLLASILLSTSCVAPTPTASPTLPETQTLAPIATQTTVSTATPMDEIVPTETPAPAEIDIKEMSRISETGELLGVKNITTNIIISDTLSNVMKGIEPDNSYKNSTEAWTEFTAKTYYDLAVKKGGADGTGLKITDATTGKTRTPTFEEYMQMAKEYQEGTRPGTDIQFMLKINNIATAGYERVTQTFAPFATEATSQPLPENVVGLTEFDLAFYRMADSSITNHDQQFKSLGSNYVDSKLMFYHGIDIFNETNLTEMHFIHCIESASLWLAENRLSNSYNTSKLLIISNNSNSLSKFRTIIKIIK